MKAINASNPNADIMLDLEKIKLEPSQNDGLHIQQKLVSVPVRKPSKEEWVQVRPGDEHSILVGVVELKIEKELYLVLPDIIPSLATETTFTQRLIFSTITRQGAFFLWPVRLPDAEGRHDTWNKSALEAVKCAQSGWCRITPNMALGAYDVKAITAQVAEPVWPKESFQELISIAFRDRVIGSIDHPVLKRLRGEI